MTGDISYWQTKPIIRRADDSFVIELESGPYHVPNEGAYIELYSAVSAYVLANPQAVTVPPEIEAGSVDFYLGPDYEKRGDDWYKIRFTKKEFLLLCGLEKVAALNAGAKENPMLAAVHDILMASEFIDVSDQDTIRLVGLLASEAGGNILSAVDTARIFGGLKYVPEN